jgi:hypothetical protein
VHYCNAVCQKKHWKEHKRRCKKGAGATAAGVVEGGRTLAFLSLHNNQLQFEGISLLAHLLRHPDPSLVGLTTLDLSGTGMNTDGLYAIARALPWSPTLTTLELERNRIEGATQLGDAYQFAFHRYCRQLEESERRGRERTRQQRKRCGDWNKKAEKQYQKEAARDAEKAAQQAEARQKRHARNAQHHTTGTDYLKYYCDDTHSTTPPRSSAGLNGTVEVAGGDGEGCNWPPSLSLTSLNLRGNKIGYASVDVLVSSIWNIPPVRVKPFMRRDERPTQRQLERRGLPDPNVYMGEEGVVTDEEQAQQWGAHGRAQQEQAIAQAMDADGENEDGGVRTFWPWPTQLQHLNLEGNLMGQRGCRALVRLLQRDCENLATGSEGVDEGRANARTASNGKGAVHGLLDVPARWERNRCSSLRTLSMSACDLETHMQANMRISPYSHAMRDSEGLTVATRIPLDVATKVAFLRYV